MSFSVAKGSMMAILQDLTHGTLFLHGGVSGARPTWVDGSAGGLTPDRRAYLRMAVNTGQP